MSDELQGNYIQFIGLKGLDGLDQERVQNICRQGCEKLLRKAANLKDFKVQFKTQETKSAKKKYSIHLGCKCKGELFECDAATDYDLARAMHKAFEDLAHRVEHVLHTSVSHYHAENVRPPQNNRPSRRM